MALEWLKEQKDKLQSEVQKFKNKSFAEGVIAGCALVAAADGSIDSSEKQKSGKTANVTRKSKGSKTVVLDDKTTIIMKEEAGLNQDHEDADSMAGSEPRVDVVKLNEEIQAEELGGVHGAVAQRRVITLPGLGIRPRVRARWTFLV